MKGSVHINSLVCVMQLTVLASHYYFISVMFAIHSLLDYGTEYQIRIFTFVVVVYDYAFEK